MNNLFYTQSISGVSLSLEDQEAAHCSLVLRKKVGEIIYVIDGKGNRYKSRIESVSKNVVACSILETDTRTQTENITIAIAPTKNKDRLEWMVEKLVEIGVERIVLMNTKNTERTRTNINRLEKKAISAVKQSLRFYIPEIVVMEYVDVLKIEATAKYIAHCYDDLEKVLNIPPLDKTIDKVSRNVRLHSLILIGPEGDFTTAEVGRAFQVGFQGLDLGEFRLRTETAAIVAVTRFQ